MHGNLNSPVSSYQMSKRLNNLPGEIYANQEQISKHKAHLFFQTGKESLALKISIDEYHVHSKLLLIW